ncbi:hypothetical protein BMH32_13875 [Leucobacter sp. OLJS4]|uniref:cell wall-binding repeat-containing protein n=1 Tax=unclassified Leucobacter TaxID=2621730 RepID=UPI000C49EE36|nr:MULTISPECIES: cell wall-binding repeat-containing protein [unclassified Leucobacter]PII84838.1 hypothetical protein BMH25_03590 [Leucobacter sp. OLCALW19]PII87733.1 hypothetical protein BMH26_08255 [Leucobacter sp. OLTLW20]PII93820.1 hypothetical protein BMH27_02530 [Leucobacter sp. OLAS13]PII98510.1 hypothetical protein BMH29_08205 [Leucobacter sp. OLDS2]PIJ00491.1 hypothetical protein BMH28_09290 [Leucobacter sp. OLCS4]
MTQNQKRVRAKHWSRSAAGIAVGALGLSSLVVGGAAATAAPEGPRYVPGASILGTSAETESEHYNEWHFGPGAGYAQSVEQQRNGIQLQAEAPTQVIRGNGNDLDPSADETPLSEVLDGLELVASDDAALTFQVGVRIDDDADGVWEPGESWATLRAPADDTDAWTTSRAIGELQPGETVDRAGAIAALGSNAYAISTGFLSWKPASPVLVTSFTDPSGTTRFTAEPAAPTAGAERTEYLTEIRPDEDTYPGWHNGADSGEAWEFVHETESPNSIALTGRVQLLNGFAEEDFLANGLELALTMQVGRSGGPVWVQIPVFASPDGQDGKPVFTTVRALVPESGNLADATEWEISRAVGGLDKNTPATFESVRAALGEHDVIGYGIYVDTGQSALVGSIVFNGLTTVFGAERKPVDPAPVWSRLGGADRFETAVTVSREHFPNGAKAVVLSRYDVPADALTAAPFAVKQNAPLLLTQTGTLTAATKTELQRLKPDTVYIAGGTGAVSAQVEQQVRALGVKTVRMGGQDRYATANQIAKTGWGKSGADAVFVATGRDFPDALSAGAAAGSVDAPVLLVDGKAGAARQDVQAQLSALKPAAVHIAGGTGVVSTGIESGLGKSAKVARHSGADRYATSAAIGKVWHTKSGTVYLATGAGFADALTGAAVAGGKPGPVLLVRPGCVPQPVAGVLGEIAPQAGYVLGGSGVVSERVLTNRNTCA